MGSELKPGVDAVAVQMRDNSSKVVEAIGPATMRPYAVLLRFLGFALTLVATVIVAVSKQSHTFSLGGSFNLKATAKWQYMSALVYFLVSNAIACSYATASLVTTAISKNSENNMTSLVITTSDLVMTALLFSANGAAAAVGIIGKNGNSHIEWMKVCNVFDIFCRHMTAALILSLIASTAFLCLVALSLFKLHNIKLSSR